VLCAYCYSPEHVTEDCPNLLEEVGRKEDALQYGACRATQNKKKDEEVDVQVVTRGGEKT
jgi:hypothetical protein